MTPGTGVRRRLVACTLAALCLAVAAPAAAPAATVRSTFSAGDEGWRATRDDPGQVFRRAPTFVRTGGNPGGFIRFTEADVPGSFKSHIFWSAPSRFRSARGALYGGELRFDVRGHPTTTAGSALRITGGGLRLFYYNNQVAPAQSDWTSVRIPLRVTGLPPRGEWRNSRSGAFATATEMQRVLAGLTDLDIQSNFASGSPWTSEIDNIVLETGSEPPPPEAGKSVVAQVTSGTVFIKLPSGKRIRRGSGKKSASISATKFRRYKGKANIPVGSTVDTRKGRIAITSAADLQGATHKATFYAGIFQIKQKRSTKPVTDAELVTSRRGCSSKSGRASASKKRLGRLWASGKGRFRTKARYSAASVRGTTWLTEERCDGTFTKVTRGTVAVRDKRLGKTILLTAGQSYLARAQRAASRD